MYAVKCFTSAVVGFKYDPDDQDSDNNIRSYRYLLTDTVCHVVLDRIRVVLPNRTSQKPFVWRDSDFIRLRLL